MIYLNAATTAEVVTTAPVIEPEPTIACECTTPLLFVYKVSLQAAQ